MTYDSWKTTEPDFSHPDDDTTCPHGEDAPDKCPVCEGDATIAECPRCDVELLDYDGFGVVYHPACGYCRHLSRDNGVCNYCGEMPAALAKAQERGL